MSRNPLSKLASSNEAEPEAQPKLPRKAIPHIRICVLVFIFGELRGFTGLTWFDRWFHRTSNPHWRA
ncbi:hypothetical protein BCR33DRAFT_721180 [Rhizoclosmatium globosum]|uniref:Uncharacterized protein n=1 Tax=Rhizoclosmatium globosum TaxID=329046 RepID=A0A1Y2BTC9_9FUNG|nr:hypothetical protein BCR33DRAFT_721180 [Rhizoclosmatium globosum]|eukprot:ORY37993.1 hypothetical protein BCR33DRAFT_721180 [Rhizoclosmatium globosum]